MKVKIKYLLGIVIVCIAIVAFYLANFTGFFVKPAQPDKYDNFAKCLTQKGAKMYGAYWCGHCKNQKELFGESFKYVTYIECDPKGDGAKPELCIQNNVQGFPTWIIDGKYYEGEQSLETLSSLTGCPLE
jgi:glutaredoxin